MTKTADAQPVARRIDSKKGMAAYEYRSRRYETRQALMSTLRVGQSIWFEVDRLRYATVQTATASIRSTCRALRRHHSRPMEIVTRQQPRLHPQFVVVTRVG